MVSRLDTRQVGGPVDEDQSHRIQQPQDLRTFLLRGLKVYEQVAVGYAIEGKQLRATSIRKN